MGDGWRRRGEGEAGEKRGEGRGSERRGYQVHKARPEPLLGSPTQSSVGEKLGGGGGEEARRKRDEQGPGDARKKSVVRQARHGGTWKRDVVSASVCVPQAGVVEREADPANWIMWS